MGTTITQNTNSNNKGVIGNLKCIRKNVHMTDVYEELGISVLAKTQQWERKGQQRLQNKRMCRVYTGV